MKSKRNLLKEINTSRKLLKGINNKSSKEIIENNLNLLYIDVNSNLNLDF